MRYFILSFFSLYLFLAHAEKLSCFEYKSVYQSHASSFTQLDESGQLCVQMKLFPKAYKIAELALQGDWDEAIQLQQSKGNEVFFMIELYCPKIGMMEFLNLEDGQLQFSQRVEYYHFKFLKDISFEINGRKMSVSAFDFERSYNVSPKGKFFGSIPIGKSAKYLEVKIFDAVYDKTVSSFAFSLKNMKKLPGLKKIRKQRNK